MAEVMAREEEICHGGCVEIGLVEAKVEETKYRKQAEREMRRRKAEPM